jgi:endonuclease-3
MKPARKKEFFETLQQIFPNADTELHSETPFQLMIAVILSAQTTDRQVNKVTSKFFATMKRPEDLLRYSAEHRTNTIRAVNFFNNKSKNTYKLARIMLDYTPENPTPEMQQMHNLW